MKKNLLKIQPRGLIEQNVARTLRLAETLRKYTQNIMTDIGLDKVCLYLYYDIKRRSIEQVNSA